MMEIMDTDMPEYKGNDPFYPLSVFDRYENIYEYFQEEKISMQDAFRNPNTLYNILIGSLKSISITKEDRSKMFQMNREIVDDFRKALKQCDYDLRTFRNTKRKWMTSKIEWPAFTSFKMDKLLEDGLNKAWYRSRHPKEDQMVKNIYAAAMYKEKYKNERVRSYYDLYHFLKNKKGALTNHTEANKWLFKLAMSKCPETMKIGEIEKIKETAYNRTHTFINKHMKSNGTFSRSYKMIEEFKWPEVRYVDLNKLMSNHASMSELSALE